MAKDAISFEVVCDIEHFRALQPEWNALWHEADGGFAEHFGFCHATLMSEDASSPRKLHCLIGRRNGRLALVWPLFTYRKYLWRYLTPLAPENRSPSNMLVAPECNNEEIVKAALDAAIKSARADLVEVWRVPSDSLLCQCMMSRAASRSEGHEHTYHATLRGENDWDAFCRSRPGRTKYPDQVKRKLAKHVDYDIELLDRNDERTASIVDWLVLNKRKWALAKDIDSRWVFAESSGKFWRDLMVNKTYESGMYRFFVLLHQGTPLAALIVGVGRRRLFFLTVTYDLAHSKHSPGTVILDEGVKWAFEHGLDVDFTPGDEPYKVSWSGKHRYPISSLLVMTSAWGSLGHSAKALAKQLKGKLTSIASRHSPATTGIENAPQ
ncbi:GNAT family N-acetyltransferase [Paraburkholderia fungorum]|uniref:GNAT family N-acetyltransferase n=1 Tax=Paraburkholderia fungorum TaxID=134537 RepID=UPI0038BB4206